MKAAEERAADRRWVAPYVDRIYRPALVGLPLSSIVQEELLGLLTKRRVALIDARQAFLERAHEAQLARRPLTGFGAADWNAIEARLVAEFEERIKALVDPSTFTTVREMVAAESELSQIESGYRRSFEKSGYALSPEQHRCLALALHGRSQARSARWLGHRTSKEPLNSAGLTAGEEEALTRMAGTLSAEQVDEMRRGFILTERRINGLPIGWERECDIPEDAAKRIADAQGAHGDRFGEIYVELMGAGRARLTPALRNQDQREFCALKFESCPQDKQGRGLLMVAEGIALFYDGRLIQIVNDHQVVWVTREPRPKL